MYLERLRTCVLNGCTGTHFGTQVISQAIRTTIDTIQVCDSTIIQLTCKKRMHKIDLKKQVKPSMNENIYYVV